MKRIAIILAFLAAIGAGTWAFYTPHDLSKHSHVATVAERQSFFKPGQVNPDHNFVAQPVVYSTNVIGDGSDANGGEAPAYANREPADIPSNFPTGDWMELFNSSPIIDPGEGKMRTHCNYSHSMFVDPVLYPNQVGRPHMHSFFGNTGTNQFSTYESLRKTGDSTCGAGKVNRTAYWYPSVLKDNAIGDGKTMIVKPNYIVVYYNIATLYQSRVTRIPRGLNYVAGVKTYDITDAAVKAEISGAYTYITNGFNGWLCSSGNGSYIDGVVANGPYSNAAVAGSAEQPYLRNADGTATLSCPAGADIIARLTAPECWDGRNLSSPNGRDHMRYLVRKNDGLAYCPDGWYQLPQLQISLTFPTTGQSDFKEWYLASDRVPGDTQYLNGQTFHTDWFGAWDYEVMKTWMRECNGVNDIDGASGTFRDCNNSQFGDGRKGRIATAAPDGTRNPQISLSALTGNNRYDTLPENR